MALKVLAWNDVSKKVTVDALAYLAMYRWVLPGVSHKCIEALWGMYDRAWLFIIIRSWFASI